MMPLPIMSTYSWVWASGEHQASSDSPIAGPETAWVGGGSEAPANVASSTLLPAQGSWLSLIARCKTSSRI